ncbi:MAG: sulfite exporter TauE/SafE family protein [Planctomycetota bacterium]|nr:MAG: sulfite exporter TauE/SafE family protein [Planctomycetota bacterium]
MDWLWYALLIPAGFLAGVINTLAGGGSFLTLPALMFLCGMDPRLANGTNRVAILLSSASASVTFHRHGRLDRRLAGKLAIPTLLGVPVGTELAVTLPNKAFQPLFGAMFLIMAGIMLLRPARFVEDQPRRVEPHWWWTTLIFFAIGVYVGFIQAGMGILLLLAMSLLNTGDLVASNAVKNLIGFLVTLLATAMFVRHGLVDWVPGLIMAIGNVAGGVAGARLAMLKGNRLIFGFMIAVMIFTGLRLILTA